jgi:nitrogen regulatory protein P-II 1
MKKIETIIEPKSLFAISNALMNLGVVDITVSQVRRLDLYMSQIQFCRGLEWASNFLPKIKLELVVDDHQVKMVVKKIVDLLSHQQIDNSRIIIIPIEEVTNIQTLKSTRETAQV